MWRIIFLIFFSSCTIFRWTVPVIEDRRQKTEDRLFILPVKGKITSYFGKRDGEFHKGIDISASDGDEIRASCDGVVSYADKRGTYGNVIIILHKDGFATVYAHNKKNLVSSGQKVKQGDVIGIVGQTGRATAPHLHFEIRKNGKAEDPLIYLEKQPRSAR